MRVLAVRQAEVGRCQLRSDILSSLSREFSFSCLLRLAHECKEPNFDLIIIIFIYLTEFLISTDFASNLPVVQHGKLQPCGLRVVGAAVWKALSSPTIVICINHTARKCKRSKSLSACRDGCGLHAQRSCHNSKMPHAHYLLRNKNKSNSLL